MPIHRKRHCSFNKYPCYLKCKSHRLYLWPVVHLLQYSRINAHAIIVPSHRQAMPVASISDIWQRQRLNKNILLVRPWPNFLFLLPILLFFSAQIFYPFCFLLYPFCFLSHPLCFSSSHVELINGVQYLERSTWHCGCTWHWNAINGPSKSTMPILLNLLYLTAHFASKLLVAFKSLFWSKFC